MKSAIYAGSFDPWSFGHQYVLDSAAQVFDVVHILAAVNPLKGGALSPETRARIIANSIYPYSDWWSQTLPFKIKNNVIVAATTGLVANYAKDHNIKNLVRGLRSTSDFEAEFNLYFANRAIDNKLQTWCIMCPPELLHCSSSFVHTVVGKQVDFVGTTFVAQAIMLKKMRFIGEILDLIQTLSKYRFECQPADLTIRDLNVALQGLFVAIITGEADIYPHNEGVIEKRYREFLAKNTLNLLKSLEKKQYPEEEINHLWAIMISGFSFNAYSKPEVNLSLQRFNLITPKLGKTEISLFNHQGIEAWVNQM